MADDTGRSRVVKIPIEDTSSGDKVAQAPVTTDEVVVAPPVDEVVAAPPADDAVVPAADVDADSATDAADAEEPDAVEAPDIPSDEELAIIAEGIPGQEKPEKTNRFREIMSILVKDEIMKGLTPQRVRAIIEDLGPTYVKIGQIMSMRPDMIPKEYCEELAKLRADVDPMPFSKVHKVLEEAYGSKGKLTDIFRKIDEVPLGSASIAQAHSATLRNGDRVVCKIQRPGIYETMSEDIAMLRHAALALKLVRGEGTFDFATILDEMWVVAQEEMDFLVEAKHNHQFAECNKDEERISWPKIYDEYTTSKVLVMEYIDGISAGDTQKLDAAGYDRTDLGTVFISNYLKQIVEDGYFHADPHPGNVWVRDNKIVFIDMGMMGTLSNRDRKLITQAMIAVANHDVSSLKEVVLSMGIYNDPIDHPRLYGDIDTYLTKYGSLDMGAISMATALNDLLDVAKSNGIAMPSSMSMLARGCATAEGTLSTLSKDVNIMSVVSSQVQTSVMKDYDPMKQLSDKARKLYQSGSKAIEMPGLATDFLKMTLRGRTKVNAEMSFSQESTEVVQNVVDRVVGGLIVSAFLIGSSFLCTTDMDPKILGVPALGVIGFLIAVALGGWLILDTRRRKRRDGR